jgi:hypothetical protein
MLFKARREAVQHPFAFEIGRAQHAAEEIVQFAIATDCVSEPSPTPLSVICGAFIVLAPCPVHRR